MDSDGFVDWHEILVYAKWALHKYLESDIKTADEAISVAFDKGIIPAMQDE